MMNSRSTLLSLIFASGLTLLLSTTAVAQRVVKGIEVRGGEVVVLEEIEDAVPDIEDAVPDIEGAIPDDVVAPPSLRKQEPDQKTGDGETIAPTAALKTPIDPEQIQLHLHDGMIVSGKFSVKDISVVTSYGPLTIPITRLRSFKPGLNNTPVHGERISGLVERLGSDDFAAREGAQKELLAIGLPIRGMLALQQGDDNAERERRLKTILQQLSEQADESDEVPQDAWIQRDRIATTAFTMVGDISPKTFQFYTNYGPLSINLGDIRLARRPIAGSGLQDVRKPLTLEGRYIAQIRFKNSGIKVVKGDKITVSATGTISRNNSSSYRSGPEGISRLGYYSRSPKIYGGTLIARVGGGKDVKIGARATFVAKRDGALQFAIAMRPEYATGSYQFPGQYNLTIKVIRGEQ